MEPIESVEQPGARKTEGGLSDLLRKALVAGAGALFTTEEGARSILGEVKLPKEAAQFLANQLSKTKAELFRILAKELRSFLESNILGEQVQKVLSATLLEIHTTIRFRQVDGTLQPETQNRVSVSMKGPRQAVRKRGA